MFDKFVKLDFFFIKQLSLGGGPCKLLCHVIIMELDVFCFVEAYGIE